MIQHQIPARSDPVRLVCLAALAATHGLVRLTERYLPAYVVDLGYGPIVVGALATLGLGVAATVAERSPASVGDGQSALESADDESEPSLGSITTVLASLLAAAGLLALAGAPTLDGLLGTPLTALGWLAVGLGPVGAWHAIGPTRHLWPIDTRVPPSSDDDRAPSRGESPDRRTDVVIGALAIAVAAAVATAAVASADAIAAGVSLLAVAGAAVALVAATALASTVDWRTVSGLRRGDGFDPPGGDHRDARPGDDEPTTPTTRSESPRERVRAAVSRLPVGDHPAFVGDGLVRLGIVGIVPFLVLLLVESRAVGASIGPLSLAPAGAFALFVLAEATGAVGGALGAGALASRVDRRLLLAGGLALLALVPMALLVVPSHPAAVAATFGILGARTAIEPLRPAVGRGGRSAPDPESRPPPALRSALRAALVPAPLVAGVLYAIDPVVAFTGATTVGLLGVRELCRAFEFGADG